MASKDSMTNKNIREYEARIEKLREDMRELDRQKEEKLRQINQLHDLVEAEQKAELNKKPLTVYQQHVLDLLNSGDYTLNMGRYGNPPQLVPVVPGFPFTYHTVNSRTVEVLRDRELLIMISARSGIQMTYGACYVSVEGAPKRLEKLQAKRKLEEERAETHRLFGIAERKSARNNS